MPRPVPWRRPSRREVTRRRLRSRCSSHLPTRVGRTGRSPPAATEHRSRRFPAGQRAPLFVDGLGLDSIDVLELVVAIEQRWNVRIDSRELGEQVFVSVGALADYIDEHRAAE